MKIKLQILLTLLYLMISGIPGMSFAGEIPEKYSIEKITLTGNTRISDKKIRSYLSVKEKMKVSAGDLEFLIKVTKAKLEASKLFMFIDINYEIHPDATADISISLGENVIFFDLLALEQGGFTRFSSISEKAPDFGFMVGPTAQALYLRFPNLFEMPLNLATTITHYANTIAFDPQDRYDYEGASGRLALDMTILQNWKIKVPAIFRYNILGNQNTTKTYDISSGVETLVDFSHFKNVIYTGFDMYGGIYQGISMFPYTLANAGINFYIKPFAWEEIVLRARYNKVLNGMVPDYLLFRIDNDYEVRGKIKNNYYGMQSLVLNFENWFQNIITIPAAITNINFSFLIFADLGTAGNTIQQIEKGQWNLSAGGAMKVEFNAPINLSIQTGYGQELWQNTGGQFYVKLGYEFYSGSFFE